MNAVQKFGFNADSLVVSFEKFLDVMPATVKAYKSGLKTFIKYVNIEGIKTPNAETVLNFKRDLQVRGRKPSTINLYLSAVKRFFNWTAQKNLYPNVALGVKGVKIDKGFKKDFFIGAQIKKILAGFDTSTLEGMRNYVIFALMSTCGLRTIEVARAKISDLSTIGGVPVLYVRGKGRTDAKDFVKLCPQVQQALNSYLKMRDNVDKTNALFTSCSDRNYGQNLTRVTISTICKKAMRQAGFNSDRLTAHSLRHTAVTLALMNGQSLEEVQAFARHSNINTTMVYNHAINRINSMCEISIAKEIF